MKKIAKIIIGAFLGVFLIFTFNIFMLNKNYNETDSINIPLEFSFATKMGGFNQSFSTQKDFSKDVNIKFKNNSDLDVNVSLYKYTLIGNKKKLFSFPVKKMSEGSGNFKLLEKTDYEISISSPIGGFLEGDMEIK